LPFCKAPWVIAMDVDTLRQAVEDGTSGPWVEVSTVTGYSVEDELTAAEERWYRPASEDDGTDVDSASDVMTDYLALYLSEAAIGAVPRPGGARLLNAALFLGGALGSSYALATLLPHLSATGGEQEYDLVECIRVRDQAKRPFVRDALKSFVLDVFCLGASYPGWKARIASLGPAIAQSVETLVTSDYETIDPTDARRFRDGRSRF